mmetsp:Transcript_29037/g.53137  ORF Transcript_29037/g.53137 Transcript_29037/m.53137 type:complete len:314 (-) Transcript_29037:918-1859(-)
MRTGVHCAMSQIRRPESRWLAAFRNGLPSRRIGGGLDELEFRRVSSSLARGCGWIVPFRPRRRSLEWTFRQFERTEKRAARNSFPTARTRTSFRETLGISGNTRSGGGERFDGYGPRAPISRPASISPISDFGGAQPRACERARETTHSDSSGGERFDGYAPRAPIFRSFFDFVGCAKNERGRSTIAISDGTAGSESGSRLSGNATFSGRIGGGGVNFSVVEGPPTRSRRSDGLHLHIRGTSERVEISHCRRVLHIRRRNRRLYDFVGARFAISQNGRPKARGSWRSETAYSRGDFGGDPVGKSRLSRNNPVF